MSTCTPVPTAGQRSTYPNFTGTCCVTISLKTETLHPAGKLLKQEGEQLRILQEVTEPEQLQ